MPYDSTCRSWYRTYDFSKTAQRGAPEVFLVQGGVVWVVYLVDVFDLLRECSVRAGAGVELALRADFSQSGGDCVYAWGRRCGIFLPALAPVVGWVCCLHAARRKRREVGFAVTVFILCCLANERAYVVASAYARTHARMLGSYIKNTFIMCTCCLFHFFVDWFSRRHDERNRAPWAHWFVFASPTRQAEERVLCTGTSCKFVDFSKNYASVANSLRL